MARALTRRLRRDASGTVTLEFLIAFVPVLVLVLGTMQLVLLATARLIVQHAAIMGARSAAVVLADDPKHYDGETVGRIAARGGHSDSGWLAALSIVKPTLPIDIGEARRPGPRLATIRRAVSLPLAVLAPDGARLDALFAADERTLQGALGREPISRLASALFVYDPLALALTFPARPGSSTLQTGNVITRNVTVRTTYLFHCGVPLAAALFCDTWSALQEQAREGRTLATTAMQELAHAPARAERDVLLAASNARFAVLRAEATLPLQLMESDLATRSTP